MEMCNGKICSWMYMYVVWGVTSHCSGIMDVYIFVEVIRIIKS